ncbi:MAG: BamA/TamA family outer membrane protein [Desulfatitalea sp.]|nr:outer membrane protein assembly factor [Desulfatitalea sp.]NNJ99523.1 BamA/TamA family outer membrane protein [Desulfatitalea sp.]
MNGQAAEVEDRVQKIGKDAIAAKGMAREGKFLVVPIPVSNPTLGVGLTLAGIYLHPTKTAAAGSPTSTSGVGVMATSNESYLVGVFHDGYYFNDFMRLRLAGGYGELHLKYYGMGNDSPLQDNPLAFNAKSTLVTPRLLFELPVDNLYIGLDYRYIGIENFLDASDLTIDLPEFSFYTGSAGFGLVGVYDSRDSNIWPAAGSWLEVTVANYGGHFFGDYHYNKGGIKFTQYHHMTDQVVFVYRLDGQFLDGEPPFWDLAQINLRGFPFGRYIDKKSVTAQAEIRWQMFNKWIITAFSGGGRVADSLNDIDSSPTHWAGGAGVRYNIGGDHHLNVGIDVTYADDQAGVYFQIGDWLGK